MKPKIVFLDEYTVDDADLSSLHELGDYTGYKYTDNEQVLERSREAEIIITNKVQFDAALLQQLPKLKLICVAATGMNNIDLDAAGNRGIAVRNAVDYSTDSVAELTFTVVLALYKQLIYMDEFVKSGRYAASPVLFHFDRSTHELHGKRWGVVGLGNIGRKVADIAKAFGCEITYFSTSGRNANSEYTRAATLEELLTQSDVVSVHAPLTEKTNNLIGYEQLRMMKKNAVIVNMARGPLVNEADLARALDENLVAGAALDVYQKEPMAADNPLLSIKDPYRLVMTPHQGWSTSEAIERLIDKIAANISDFLATESTN